MKILSIGLALLCGLAFGGLLIFASPQKMALAVIAATFALATIKNPRLGLLLFCFFATLIPYTTLQLGVRITLSEALLGLTWLGVAWQLLFGRMKWHIGTTERKLIWLMVFSTIPFLVGQIEISADGNGPVNWIRWLMNLSALFLVPMLLNDEKSRDQVIVALLSGTLAMLLLSFAYFLKNHNANSFIPILEKLHYAHPEAVKDIFSANYTRLATPWVHPNLTGGVLVLFLPLAFFYALSNTSWRRLLGASVGLLGSAGLLFSISRGAIASLVIVLLWLTYKKAPFTARIIGLAVTLGLALVLFYHPLQERLSTMFSSNNASTEVRLDEYKRFPDAVSAYPMGVGFKIDPPPPNSGLLGISNLWLNFIYKIGFPGMILFIIISISWWKEVRPRALINHIYPERAVWIGSTAGVLAALLTGFFDHYYSFTMVLIALFWLMMGLSLQSARRLGSTADELISEKSPLLEVNKP